MIEEHTRITVIRGEHAGRHGSVTLLRDGKHRVWARLVGLHERFARVTLDADNFRSKRRITVPISCLVVQQTRLETDVELYHRIATKHETWEPFLTHAMNCHGLALDDCAHYVGTTRKQVPIDNSISRDTPDTRGARDTLRVLS